MYESCKHNAEQKESGNNIHCMNPFIESQKQAAIIYGVRGQDCDYFGEDGAWNGEGKT